jgi:hypothetical protein
MSNLSVLPFYPTMGYGFYFPNCPTCLK